MIIDADKYKGDHRFVSIPADGEFTGTVYKPIMRTSEGTGQYSLIMANCDDNGRDVEIDGQYVWKSKGGYLPGSLFDDWHFVIFSTLCYVGLFTWYLIGMKKNSESTIGIQKWILATIALGLVETFFQTSDYTIWNHSGFRSYKTMYTCKKP
jgi:heme/copper-type cytochrome/quinol oxidase subunit 3